jgi:hypothetical protein
MARPGSVRPPVESLRYGVAAVAVAVVIVAVVLWVAFNWQPSPASSSNCGLECCTVHCPYGVGMAIVAPQAEGGPGDYSYRMGVVPANGLTWGQTTFAVVSSTGTNLTPTPSWAVRILAAGNGTSGPIGVYGFESGTWSTGTHLLATSGQTIQLYLGSTDLRGQGASFVVFLSSSPGSHLNGQVTAALP